MSITERYDDTLVARADGTVEIHRNAGLAAVLGAVAAAIAIAWFGRAVQDGGIANWATFTVVAGVAGLWLRSFVDARTPLLVADQQGVRLRLGQVWHGLPWADLDSVQHQPRRGLLKDGRLVLVPSDEVAQLEQLEAAGRRAARLNRRIVGAPFAVALGMTTKLPTLPGDLTAALRRLAAGQTAVIEPADAGDQHVVEVFDDEQFDGYAAPELVRADDEPEPNGFGPAQRLGLRLRRGVGGLLGGHARPDDIDFADEFDTDEIPVVGPEPVRDLRAARRSDVVSDSASEETQPLHGRELRRAGSVNRVEESAAFEPAPAPVDAFEEAAVEPAPEPVIGPVLAAARERLGLSVDVLAERTRIRPHVIEAIEVDDFAPCGGDFYAKGHLRTLARILGIDAAPLVTDYDQRYADAPIDARRVFEAELATGTHGIRGTAGGPRWSVLVAAVMAVVLAWSVARLLMDDAKEVRHPAISLSQGSGGPNNADNSAQRVTIKITALSSTAVKVTNARGKVVFTGDVAVGDIHRIDVLPPVKVQAGDAGAIDVEIDGDPRGTVGESGQPGRKTYRVAR